MAAHTKKVERLGLNRSSSRRTFPSRLGLAWKSVGTWPSRIAAIRWRRYLAMLLIAFLGVNLVQAVIFMAVTARLFIWPPSDEPGRTDAVVVLSGDTGDRMAKALRLMQQGVAGTLVHAGTPDSQQVLNLCNQPQRFRVICLQPNPDSTRAEAQSVASLARARHWRSIAVVTSTQHVTRAKLHFRRCVEAEVRMVESHPSFSGRHWYEVLVHEWGGLLYALLLERSC